MKCKILSFSDCLFCNDDEQVAAGRKVTLHSQSAHSVHVACLKQAIQVYMEQAAEGRIQPSALSCAVCRHPLDLDYMQQVLGETPEGRAVLEGLQNVREGLQRQSAGDHERSTFLRIFGNGLHDGRGRAFAGEFHELDDLFDGYDVVGEVRGRVRAVGLFLRQVVLAVLDLPDAGDGENEAGLPDLGGPESGAMELC